MSIDFVSGCQSDIRKSDVIADNVIILEFNELTPVVMDRFIAAGQLPNFKRMREQSEVFVSDAQEAVSNLEPWIQWVTVHSGQSYDEHGVFNLGDGPKLQTKQVWDIVSDAGLRVWVCGSMNMRYDTPINGCMLPDPWTSGAVGYPSGEFEPYMEFVRRNVQEHTNEDVGLSKVDYLRFIRFMVSHGLTLSTALAIVRQLGEERLTGKARWRRAVLLDRLQWDLFCQVYRRLKPNLSTMFLNSTAHFQHVYWRNMEPDKFKLLPSEAEQAEYESAILHGYKEMDRIVGKALDLAGKDGTLILCSALGQQPCLSYEDTGGKMFYRPRVIERMLEWAGIEPPYRVEPLMSEQFYLHFTSLEAAAAAAALLEGLRVDGRSAMLVELDGSSLITGCCINERIDKDTQIERGDNREPTPFFRLFYQVKELKSGMHHPEGILWIRRPGQRPAVFEEKVPLRSVAPTVLSFFGLEKAPHMSGQAVVLGGADQAGPAPLKRFQVA